MAPDAINESGLDENGAVSLLKRYGTLRERLGIARASRARLPEGALEELGKLEDRLVELLRRAGADADHSVSSATSRDARAPNGSADAETRRGGERHPAIAPPDEAEEAQAAPPAQDPGLPPRATLTEKSRPPLPSAASSALVSEPTTAIVYTDGSAEGNPGPGGFCALVRMPGRPDRELSGGTVHTTNNKMELTAAIAGLRAAIEAEAREVTVVTDSEYLVKGMRDWLPGWERKGWKTATGQPVKNRELWEQLATLVKGRAVRWDWVRGHAGHPENERCDLVATTRAREAAQRGS